MLFLPSYLKEAKNAVHFKKCSKEGRPVDRQLKTLSTATYALSLYPESRSAVQILTKLCVLFEQASYLLYLVDEPTFDQGSCFNARYKKKYGKTLKSAVSYLGSQAAVLYGRGECETLKNIIKCLVYLFQIIDADSKGALFEMYTSNMSKLSREGDNQAFFYIKNSVPIFDIRQEGSFISFWHREGFLLDGPNYIRPNMDKYIQD